MILSNGFIGEKIAKREKELFNEDSANHQVSVWGRVGV